MAIRRTFSRLGRLSAPSRAFSQPAVQQATKTHAANTEVPKAKLYQGDWQPQSSQATGKPFNQWSESSKGVLEQLAQIPAAEVSHLSNGLKVATEQTSGDSATVMMMFNAGSRYENPENCGVAHFAEHLYFKGTPNRSRQQMETEIENMGAQFHAYTSRETTVFYIKCAKQDAVKATEILSDVLCNASFDADAVEAEKHAILLEEESVGENLQEVALDLLHATAYRGHPLEAPILGTRDNIRNMTREKLIDYKENMITASRATLVGINVDHDTLVSTSQQTLAGLPQDASRPVILEGARFTGSSITQREDGVPEAHWVVGFPTAGYDDPDLTALSVMRQMMGFFDSSRNSYGQANYHTSPNVTKLAFNRGVHQINPLHILYSDTGLWGVHMVAEPLRLSETSLHLMEEITRLSYEVDEDDLEAHKNMLKTQMLISQDCVAQAELLARNMTMHGRPIHTLEQIARVDNVDAATVQRVARRYFYDRDLAVAAIGMCPVAPDYNRIRFNTYRWWM